MNNQFIMIYSDGPMGSSSLGSLFEKYGYINLPFRKFRLSEYVMGIRDITDQSMQNRFLENINILSEEYKIGGTSVKDRDSRKGEIRTIKPTQEAIKIFLSFKPKTLQSLLSHCFIFAAKHITYKEFNIPIRGFIIYELPQFRIKYKFTQKEYLKKLIKLEGFTCILMNRNFREWSASLISQQDYRVKIPIIEGKISLEKLFLRWKYNQNLTELKDLITIDIDSLLLPNTDKINILISKLLKVPLIKKEYLINQRYDLYGSLMSYKSAFTPSDKSFTNSNFFNKLILKNYIRFPKYIRKIVNIIFNIIRCMGLFKMY